MSDDSKFKDDKLGTVKCYVKGVDVGGKKVSQVIHRRVHREIGEEIQLRQDQFARLEALGRVSKSPIIVN